MLVETDQNDPCDPDPECAACLALKPTPKPTTPTPTIPPPVTPTAAPATPTPTPEEPGFEAVFANFFAPQKPLLKMQVSLAKLFFLRKGLCLDTEGTRNRKSSKGKNQKL
jgi:hypothetical protein